MIDVEIYDEENETTILIQAEKISDSVYKYSAEIITDEKTTNIEGEFHSVKELSSLELIEKIITFTRWENIE